MARAWRPNILRVAVGDDVMVVLKQTVDIGLAENTDQAAALFLERFIDTLRPRGGALGMVVHVGAGVWDILERICAEAGAEADEVSVAAEAAMYTGLKELGKRKPWLRRALADLIAGKA